jgi:prepilin-type processing-associated H-X9-DG protein
MTIEEFRFTHPDAPENKSLRAGGFGLSTWIVNTKAWWAVSDWDRFMERSFATESTIPYASWTPLLFDSIWFLNLPLATDFPAVDLATGSLPNWPPTQSSMHYLTIPRHGSRPRPVPRNWPASRRLPGAINVAFFDGHVEQVQLERLWQLYWHKDYVPPAKRQGLP